MREFSLDALPMICLIALACLFVAIVNARIGQLEWWLDAEEAEIRPRGRFAFIGANWFFYASGGIFVTTAVVLKFLLH